MSLISFSSAQAATALRLPLYLSRVSAGFPSPADDYVDKGLDLNEYLITHPAATFFTVVSGESMEGEGIFDGDILVVNRALEAVDGDVVVAVINGELSCKLLDTKKRRLLSSHPDYPPIPVFEGAELVIEGVVPFSIRCHRDRHR
ncbi:translesion error-prone DNA polymerase V autoproteolytic subunit [Aestuariirhabdus sp. Z084]|uniref:LexA family protein n=1 Tax=Aestuariirhabdus haliotis TaxID=2918751 RepID=UPI00201B3748|nr:translesion error-prone DNA polymerase V autoproteolytic subunit [Aestuariirhabdus haliotis]MCL6417737.1 translesion error-prone DNA polymerase V autoproteolytic subunit [Aestuariirhabdus haliotis]MCL6421676.1 translesion error-prone DNA polymerase V autoproteolytic subunit [Aestuariirhabdus haliotis]